MDYSQDAAQYIALRPVAITVVRGGTKLDPQTVRVEAVSATVFDLVEVNVSHNVKVSVWGYKDHPDHDDLDIQTGDVFTFEGQRCTVSAVVPGLVGRVLAIAEVSE